MNENKNTKMTENRVKNQNNDFTTGDVQKKLIKFAIPIILGSIFMQLYNYVDLVIVGRYLGKEALVAVGASAPFIFMLVSLVIGISIGTTILIAQYFGKNDYVSIKKASDSLYIFLIISSLILSVVGIIFNRQIMELISLPDEIIPQAIEYLNVFLIGLIFMFLFNGLSAILRGVGDSKSPLIFLVIASVINIILDLLFVVVFEWGVEGVAWATVIAQTMSVVFAFLYIHKKNHTISTNLLNMTFDKKIFLKSIKIGIPSGIQQLLLSVGMLAIMSLVNAYGTNIIAGYVAASKIEAFMAVFPLGLSIAITSFTAQNYGANLIDRVREGVRVSIKISIIASIIGFILLSALAHPLMKMFTTETEVISVGVHYLYVFAGAFIILNIMFCYIGALKGMGNTIATMLITLFAFWLIRVPMAILLSNTQLEEMGIWISAAIAWAIGAVFAYVLYRKEYKKRSLIPFTKQNLMTNGDD